MQELRSSDGGFEGGKGIPLQDIFEFMIPITKFAAVNLCWQLLLF